MPSAKKRLLLVEDEQTARLVLSKRLAALLPCQLDYADNGYQAVQFAEQYYYHAIFMDIGLPGLSGTDACQAIKANSKSASCTTPLVAVTAYTSPTALEHYRYIGMQAILLKPISERNVRRLLLTWGWLTGNVSWFASI